VTANQASQNRGELELTFEASGLKKSTLANYFIPPDPFLDIVSCGTSSSSGGGSPQKRAQLLKRTLCLSATRTPNWPSICLPLKALKNSAGDYCSLSLQCYHFRDDGDHLLIGEAQIQARQLLEAPVTFNLKKNVRFIIQQEFKFVFWKSSYIDFFKNRIWIEEKWLWVVVGYDLSTRF